MKFGLIIWVCAFLGEGSSCINPIKYPTLYDSWYECSRSAYKESLKVLTRMGYAYVNKYQIGVKYNCEAVQTY